MKRMHAGVLTAIVSAVLTACGGGSDDSPPERGTIVTAQLRGQASTAQIDAGTAASGLQPLSGRAACAVDIRYMVYMTRDPLGQLATASAAVFVPSGSAAPCTGERPVVLYAHGTTTAASYNIADVSRNPSGGFNNAAGEEGSLLMAMYAAQGFIVVAPNYLGHDRGHTSLPYHPYLNAEAQAVDMVDGLRAARTHLAADSATKPSSKLFVTGYSQGGYVAMATHRALERDYAGEFTVTASAGMSGPYNLVGFGDAITQSDRGNVGGVLFLPLMLTSYQKAYGNIYGQPSEVYQAPYAPTAETLFPTDTPVSQLMQEGKLPADTQNLFGTGGLLKPEFKAAYATSNFRKALVQNTLAGSDNGTTVAWKPQRPVALCGGKSDPTVYYAPNTPVAAAALTAQGATVRTWDVETAPAMTDPTFPVFAAFQQWRDTTVSQQGVAAMLGAYHGRVAPYCNTLVRGFFSTLAAQ